MSQYHTKFTSDSDIRPSWWPLQGVAVYPIIVLAKVNFFFLVLSGSDLEMED